MICSSLISCRRVYGGGRGCTRHEQDAGLKLSIAENNGGLARVQPGNSDMEGEPQPERDATI